MRQQCINNKNSRGLEESPSCSRLRYAGGRHEIYQVSIKFGLTQRSATTTSYHDSFFAMKILQFLSLGVLTSSVYASSGDRSFEFVDSVNLCKTQQCSTKILALPLRVTRWTCTDDCKYQCMHQITDRDLQRGKPVQQYYGKWPFWRLAGMQEPASVAFSFLNLWAHARGASKIRRRVSEHHPMKSYYLVWSMVSINAWIWSSVFHTRGRFEYLYLQRFSPCS